MASPPVSAGLSPRLSWPHPQPLLASTPTPLRMERGVICEVTPISLLKEGEGMPDGRRESYEAVPRRPELQGTEGPALSMSPVFSVPLLPCLKHTLLLSQRYPAPVSALCYSSNLFICYPVFLIPCPYLSPLLLIELVHLLPCLSHTMSYLSPLLLIEPVHLLPCLLLQATCSPVYSSTCQLTTLPCLSHTLSPYPPYPVPLSSLPCPYPVTKKVKPYSFTFFFFPLLSLLIRSRAVTIKTYFVCPP